MVRIIIESSVWKTINTGGKKPDPLIRDMEASGNYVSEFAKRTIRQPTFPTSPQPEIVQFGRALIRDLAFTEKPTTTELFARVELVGVLCKPEDGPHLRLHDGGQEAGDRYWTLMHLTDEIGCPVAFSLGRGDNGQRYIDIGGVIADFRWELDDSVVFRLR